MKLFWDLEKWFAISDLIDSGAASDGEKWASRYSLRGSGWDGDGVQRLDFSWRLVQCFLQVASRNFDRSKGGRGG